MDKAALVSGIAKLAKVGQQAGFSIEQMIQLLDAGLGVEGLIELIAWRFEQPKQVAPAACSSGVFEVSGNISQNIASGGLPLNQVSAGSVFLKVPMPKPPLRPC